MPLGAGCPEQWKWLYKNRTITLSVRAAIQDHFCPVESIPTLRQTRRNRISMLNAAVRFHGEGFRSLWPPPLMIPFKSDTAAILWAGMLRGRRHHKRVPTANSQRLGKRRATTSGSLCLLPGFRRSVQAGHL